MPPPGHTPADDETLLERSTAGLPGGIQLELDGRYAAMFSYKMKTYALLDERGRLSLKGSAFRSRGLEPFQRQIIGEIVRCLVDGRRTEARAVIDRWLADFAAHRVELRAFARTETLQESLEAYREKVRIGARSASAAYELAGASGRSVQPGDQVSYYVAGRGPNVDGQRVREAGEPVGCGAAGRERRVLPGQGPRDLGPLPRVRRVRRSPAPGARHGDQRPAHALLDE